MEFIDQWAEDLLGFITAHGAWAGPIVAVTAFGESLAFISLLLPGTMILIGAGGLVSAGALDFWVVYAWALPAAALGDSVSYWVGLHYKDRITGLWPFSRHPEMLGQGHRFFARWGGPSVFIGRFFGPLRAVVPLMAGLLAMPQGRFQLYNILSAIVWVPVLLGSGAMGERAIRYLWNNPQLWPVAGILVVIAVGLMLWIRRRLRGAAAIG